MKRLLYSQKIAPLVFVAPFVLTLAVFWISPLIKSGIMSTQNILPGVTESVGWKNSSVSSATACSTWRSATRSSTCCGRCCS